MGSLYFIHRYKLYLIYILITVVQTVSSQSRIDSLEYILAKVYTDTSYASLPSVLDLLSHEYRYKNPVKSLEYANELKDIADESGDLQYTARAYNSIGNTYFDLGIYYLAYENYYSALKLYKTLNNTVELAYTFNSIGYINFSQGLYDLALDHYNKALAGLAVKDKTVPEVIHNEAIAFTYCNIAWVFKSRNEMDTARYLLEKALEIRKANGDMARLGNSLLYFGQLETDYDENKAIGIFEQALNLFEVAEDRYYLAFTYKHIGDVHKRMQNYDQALDNYQKALEISLNEGNRFQVIILLTTISSLYLDIERIEEAGNMADKVLDLSVKSNFLIQQRDIYKLQSEIHTRNKDFRAALEKYKKYAALLDSIYSNQVIQTLTRIEVLNETEIREREIAIQKLSISRKNILLLALLMVIVLMGVVVVIIIRRHNYIKTTSQIIREQQHKIYDQQKKIMEQNEENLRKELAFKNQEITYKTMNLLHSNEHSLKLIQELTEANRPNQNPGIDKIIRSLNAKIKTESSEKTWEEFEILFMQLHQDFFTRLNNGYPDLTTNEKRLCSFLRLNMTTKDISTITGQSIRSIEIARTRLRKKLNLKQEENLVNFILSL